jgi:hypothetical protein
VFSGRLRPSTPSPGLTQCRAPGLFADLAAIHVGRGPEPEHDLAAARALPVGMLTVAISDRRGLDLLVSREVGDRTVVSVGQRFQPGGFAQDVQRGRRDCPW